MASRQVLRLCKKIDNDCGVVCKPETFCVERENQSFYVWWMDIDIDKTTGISERALEMLNCPRCTSSYYMKDLLKEDKLTKKIDFDDGEIIIRPQY